LLVAAAAVAAVLAMHLLVRRRLHPAHVARSRETAGIIMDALAGLYGVLIAFILAGAWERFEEMRSTVSVEANALADLAQIASLFPAPVQAEFGALLEEYRVSALAELSYRGAGGTGREAGASINRLWLTVARFEPGTPGEVDLQARALAAVEELGDMRRNRLHGMRRTLPPLLWLMLIGGGVAVLGVAALSSTGGRLPTAFIALLAGVLVLALYTVYALSYPLRSGLTEVVAPLLDRDVTRPPAG